MTLRSRLLAPTALATLALGAALTAQATSPRLTLRMAHDAEDRSAVVASVALSGDGALVAAAGDDHRVRLWRASDGVPVQTFTGHRDWVRGVRFDPDRARVATVADDQTLRLWELATPSAPAPRRLLPTEGPLRAVAFRADGRRLATVGYGAGLRIYDAATARPIETHGCPCEDMNAVAYSSDGRWIAAGGRSGRVRLWDLERGGVAVDLPGDGRRIRAVAFAPGGETLAAAGDGPAVRVWTIEPIEAPISPSLPAVGADAPMREILTRPGKNYSLAFATDRLLAVGGTSNTIRLFDTDTGSPRGELLGHTGTVAALAASADGATLASGSFDTTVRVWSIDEALLGEDRVAGRAETGSTSR